MKETGHTITEWADATFGPCDLPTAISRVEEEFNELDDLLSLVTTHNVEVENPEALADFAEECADVAITLARACAMVGADLFQEVDRKMEVNRRRQWRSNGDGTGQHV